MIELKNKLSELLSLASEFNTNDILVNITENQTVSIVENTTQLPLEDCQKLISKAQFSIKESGINPLCLVHGSITWNRNNVEISSPLLIIPTSFVVNKIRKSVELEYHDEAVFVNPFVVKQLQSQFDIQTELPNDLEALIPFLTTIGFPLVNSELCVIGNFHHHRYEVVKELDDLLNKEKFPTAIKKILGFTDTSEVQSSIKLSAEGILPSDDDHRLAFQLFETEDIAIQGPPGTGKSQILTNFIGKSLKNEHSLLVVSEKRSALEVISQRLEALNLAHFSFIASPDLASKELLQSLKSSWEFLENFTPTKSTSISIYSELENNLQLRLAILSQPNLIGNVSYSTFQSLRKGVNLSNFIYSTRVPDLNLLQTKSRIIQEAYLKELNEIVSHIRYATFENDLLQTLPDYFDELLEAASIFEVHFNAQTWGVLDQLVQFSITCQLFEHTLALQHKKILIPTSKEQKLFLKTVKKYQSIQQKLTASSNFSDWKLVPSAIELVDLKEKISSPTFWKLRATKKRWKEVSHLSFDRALASIEHLQGNLLLQQELNELEDQLHALGIIDVSTELPQILHLIPLFTQEKWELWNELSEEKKVLISSLSSKIERFKSTVNLYFKFDHTTKLVNYFEDLRSNFQQVILLSNGLKELNQSCFDTLKMSATFEQFKTTVLGSHFTNFKNNYPILSQFEMSSLSEIIDEIIESETVSQRLIVTEITQTIVAKFERYQQLITTPGTKLSSEKKALKSQLKKGKAILVKEFSKTKSHPTLRELFSSDARLWIQLLKPVWLSNPTQLAKCFPMEASLFDICIFDEASQIPLQNGLGAIYRSNRLIVAGDEHQMGPSSYFKSGSEEQLSLLHQSNFYLKKVALKHHYRSKYPELIAFSNTHFYHNELKVFPNYPHTNYAISTHFVENGRFIQRRNEVEAKRVCELIAKALQSAQKSIGIIAFSQEQVDCIWETLTEELKQQLELLIESNNSFIKPLEKVQGDECAHLIISLGYAKDEEGNFALRFGPLNQQTGRNRLNVLFSRASEHIDFVSSIRAEDLKMSENESINLLRSWLRFIESTKDIAHVEFPFELKPIVNANELKFLTIHDHISSANELVTLHRVLKNRGWKINYA